MSNAKKMLLSAAGNAGEPGLDITDVFSTYLYLGTGQSQAIVNGTDLDGEGGLVWLKRRDGAEAHYLYDTERGTSNSLFSNQTDANTSISNAVTSFNTNGFTLGTYDSVNSQDGHDYVSWSFRKAEKFFDVVTYTGNGSVRTISHGLNCAVGSIFIKRLDNNNPWIIFHRSNGATGWMSFDTAAFGANSGAFNNTMPTDSVFTLGTRDDVNNNGNTYVAYLFAHNDGDGEFGPGADQDIIKCGTYTEAGSGAQEINLGFEPQWIMVKPPSGTGDWWMYDTMRGQSYGGSNRLKANVTDAEAAQAGYFAPTPNGFIARLSGSGFFGSGVEVVYMAIRRGPLAPPEAATEVFEVSSTTTARLNGNKYDSNLNPPDLYIHNKLSGNGFWFQDRLRGWKSFSSRENAAEESSVYIKQSGNQEELEFIDSWDNATTYTNYYFRRAPLFFDTVCYSGTNSATTISHNLTVAPEMMWVKSRANGNRWTVFHKDIGPTKRAFLDLSQAFDTGTVWNNTAPTSTVFSVGTDSNTNYNGHTFVAYLFASVAGVSKCGSVSHSGTTNVDCGFASGSRWVMLKRTDAAGGWYVWDSVRGIVAGNDPYLFLDTSGANVTNTDFIDPLNAGFTISDAFTDGDYIFWAIA